MPKFYGLKCDEGWLPFGVAKYIDGYYRVITQPPKWCDIMGYNPDTNPEVRWHLANGSWIRIQKATHFPGIQVSLFYPNDRVNIQYYVWYPKCREDVNSGSSVDVWYDTTDSKGNRGFVIAEWEVNGDGKFDIGDSDFSGTTFRSLESMHEWAGDGYKPIPIVFPGPDNEQDPPGGDGGGPDDIEDEPIEFPDAPDITVTDAGLMTLYTPTQGQIHAFGDFLWSDAFSLDTFKKLFADPMQAVIGLSIVPVAVPTAGAQPITIGAVSSGVTANRAASQYVVHDCGTLTVKPVWNTALDFSPYTKFSIYLPFIGTRELKTDDIMGQQLNVKYFVDVLSGACTAHISVGGSVLYQFSGSCATPVPLSAMNWNSTLTSMIQLAGAGIAMAVTGGAAAPAAAGMLTTATGMIGNKPNVQRSGAVSGAAGMLGVKTPYLIRETPRQSLAKDYAHYSGYPSNITAVLGTLKGFTMVENMHLKNIDATADELDEIETALKEGVIL